MNMLQLYESILNSAGLVVSKDGSVSVALDRRNEPLTIKGKRLVIPTKEQLKTPDFSNRIVFHPLAENLLASETDAFQRYRTCMVSRFNVVIGALMNKLMTIAASPAEHKKLTPEQNEYLLALKDVDEKCVENLKKILGKVPLKNSAESFVSMYVKRNGSYEGNKVPRVAVVNFPFYGLLKQAEDDRTVLDIKLRVRDYTAVKALLEYIIPDVEDPGEKYNSGSDSKFAPYLISFMRSVKKLAEHLNHLVDLYCSDDKEEHDSLYIRTDWNDLIEDLTPIEREIRAVPNQDSSDIEPKVDGLNGNLQNFNSPDPQPQQPEQKAAPAPVQPQQPAAQPNLFQGFMQNKIAQQNRQVQQMSQWYGPQGAPAPQGYYPNPAYPQAPMQQPYPQPAPMGYYPQQPYQQPYPQQYPQQQMMQPQGYNPYPRVGAYGYPIHNK